MSRDFLGRVTRTLREGARVVVRESEEVARMAKIRLDIAGLAGKRDDLWREIGQKVFTQFEEGREVPAEVIDLCQQVRETVEKMRAKEKELAALRAQSGERGGTAEGAQEAGSPDAAEAGPAAGSGTGAAAGTEGAEAPTRCPHCGGVIR